MTNCLPKKDQLVLLLSHCPPHTRLIATMLADTGMRHREELGAMTRSWVHFDKAPFPRIVIPGEASKNRLPRTIRMTKRVEALLREIMENGLVFDVCTDTNDNGGGGDAQVKWSQNARVKGSHSKCHITHGFLPL